MSWVEGLTVTLPTGVKSFPTLSSQSLDFLSGKAQTEQSRSENL